MSASWRNPDLVRAMLAGRTAGVAPEIGLRDLAIGVFLFPGQVLVAVRTCGRWHRPLALLALALLLIGLLVGGAGFPRLYRDAVAWADWFGGLVQEFRITADGFSWDYPDALPFTTSRNRWRVDFADDAAAMAPHQATGREERGVWITRHRVVLWWLLPAGDSGKLRAERSLRTADLTPSVRRIGPLLEGGVLPGERFAAYARRLLLAAVPLYLAVSLASVVVPVMAYVMLFTLLSHILRRRDGSAGFGAVFAVNALCAVPSVCVAGVYAAVGVPALDFTTVFVLAFFLYILLAFHSVRNMMIESP